MRSWVLDGPRSLNLELNPVPQPGPSEVRIRVSRVGICGSDIASYRGQPGMAEPGTVLGHEASGVVDAVGRDISGLELEEPVTFAPIVPCDGRCGHRVENLCEDVRLIGVDPSFPGALADYIVLPADRVFRLANLPLSLGAVVEPIAVGLHAARRAGPLKNSRVLIIGGGMIGQAAAQSAVLEGARSVALSDPHLDRQAMAQRCGVEAIAAGTETQMGRFDSVIDAAGTSASVTTAVQVARRGGTVCVVGLGATRATIPLFDVVDREIAVLGASCYSDAEFSEAIAALEANRFLLMPLAPMEVAFEDVPAIFEQLANRVHHPVRVSVTIQPATAE